MLANPSYAVVGSYVVCCNKDTGSIYWRAALACYGISRPLESFDVDEDGTLITIGWQGQVLALNAKNGRKKWFRKAINFPSTDLEETSVLL